MSDTIPNQQYPEALVELAAIVDATLIDGGVEADLAHKLSQAVAGRVRVAWGGHRIYIRSSKFTVDYMRSEIARRWDGTNTKTRELCDELEISESRLRQLANEARVPKPV